MKRPKNERFKAVKLVKEKSLTIVQMLASSSFMCINVETDLDNTEIILMSRCNLIFRLPLKAVCST